MESRWSIGPSVEFIRQGGYRRVALQFPDALLQECVSVTEELQRELERTEWEAELHILADSAYDSACVDAVAAEHVEADCVIHYGPASLTGSAQIPTFYVVPNEKMDAAWLDTLKKAIAGSRHQNVLVFLGGSLEHKQQEITAALASREEDIDVQVAATHVSLDDEQRKTFTDEMRCSCLCGYHWKMKEDEEMESCLCVWIGEAASEAFYQLQLHLATSPWISLSPQTGTVQVMLTCRDSTSFSFSDALQHGLSSSVTRMLRRRTFLVEKAREADIVGILVSTVSVNGVIETASTVKQLAQRAGKHVYEMVIAKPNPSKLANFPEIDVFVLVCDPQAMILDCKEFLAPCVTPYEAQMAFTGGYLSHQHYRYHLQLEDISHPESSDQQLMLRHDRTLATTSSPSAVDYFLTQRQFRGLQPNVPSTVSPILPGRSGTASGYADEPNV